MKLENQVSGLTHKILFLPKGSQDIMEGDLTTSHTTSRDGKPVLIDPTTGTAYSPAEVVAASSGPEQESQLRDAGYQVMERAALLRLREVTP